MNWQRKWYEKNRLAIIISDAIIGYVFALFVFVVSISHLLIKNYLWFFGLILIFMLGVFVTTKLLIDRLRRDND